MKQENTATATPKNTFIPVLAWLSHFLAQERKRYAEEVFTKGHYRTSHHLLKNLVPAHRNLNVMVRQPGAFENFKTAPRKLAETLVANFIFSASAPEGHDIWALPISGELLRELVFEDSAACPEWLQYAAFCDDFRVWAIRNIQGATLGELRACFLAEYRNMCHTRADELQGIMARVKAILSEREYALLSATMLTIVPFTRKQKAIECSGE